MITDLEAERCLVGCVFLDGDCVVDFDGLVSAEDFADGFHRRAYQHAYDAVSRGEIPDPILVGSQMGGIEATAKLVAMVENVPGIEQARQYARAVAMHGRQRRMLAMCKKAARELEEVSTEDQLRVLISETLEQLGELGEFKPSRDLDRAAAYRLTLREMENIQKEKKAPGWATGLSAIDDVLFGLKRKQLVVIAAQPGAGKTALALNVALACAKQEGTVYFCSHEMGVEDLTKRDMAISTGMAATKIELVNLQSQDWSALELQRDRPLKITFTDSPPETVGALRAACQKRKRRHGLDMLIVDYLQLMTTSDDRKNKEQAVSEISRGLKRIAMDLDVCVIALSQLNRGVERNEMPTLNNLRDSGAIAQDANTVLMLWSENEKQAPIRFAVAKNRSGKTGDGTVLFDRITQRFRNL